jgi:hypothetical protein
VARVSAIELLRYCPTPLLLFPSRLPRLPLVRLEYLWTRRVSPNFCRPAWRRRAALDLVLAHPQGPGPVGLLLRQAPTQIDADKLHPAPLTRPRSSGTTMLLSLSRSACISPNVLEMNARTVCERSEIVFRLRES